MSLTGKVALITGGGKNLGAEIARRLAPESANLALHYNSARTKDATLNFRDELQKQYPKIRISLHSGDLTSAAAVERLFADVLTEHKRIDIVVNTVGKVLKKPIVDISEAEYDEMFAVNSKAAFFIIQQAAKHVSDGGKIISLVSALLGANVGGYTSYAGSKAPVDHFTRGVAHEVASREISVNAIAPGPMDTPFLYGQESDEAVGFLKSMGMGNRLTDVKDIGPLVKFLVTEGGWITGQTIFANGGFSTR